MNDYLNDYIEAIRTKDEKWKRQIERDLARLGMDYMTLMFLVNEKLKEAMSGKKGD